MSRRCARPDCHQPASVTLAYDYANSTVWLEPLAAETHPMTHDLCDRHGDALSVPRGWQLRDRRARAKPARGDQGPVVSLTDRAVGSSGALAS